MWLQPRETTKSGWGLGLKQAMCFRETVRNEKRGDEARDTWTLNEPPFPAPFSPPLLSWWLTAGTNGNPGRRYSEEWRSAAEVLMYVQVADLVKDVNHTGCCENETWCSLYVWAVRHSASLHVLALLLEAGQNKQTGLYSRLKVQLFSF